MIFFFFNLEENLKNQRVSEESFSKVIVAIIESGGFEKWRCQFCIFI